MWRLRAIATLATLAVVLTSCGADDAALVPDDSVAAASPFPLCDPNREMTMAAPSDELLYVVEENASIEDRKLHGERSTIRLVSATSSAEGIVLAGPDNAPRSPVWSPDGQSVAYTASVDGATNTQRELFVMAWDGSNVRRLTEIGGVIGYPSWSPDGSRLLFIQHQLLDYGVHESGIFVVNLDGTGLTRLSPNGWRPDGASIAMSGSLGPQWTPDGAGVIYAERASADASEYRFVFARVDGTGDTALDELPSFESLPVWSPDGCDRVSSGTIDDDHDSYDLIISREGGEPQPLTTGPPADFSPAWSPEGDTIAFVRMQSSDGSDPVISPEMASTDLFLIDVDGTNERQLTELSDVKMMPPVWSPDGTTLAFAAYSYAVESLDLYVIDADGTDLRMVANGLVPGEVYPSWRPAAPALNTP